MKPTEFKKLIREEVRKIIKEEKLTYGMIEDYWSIMVENQPEDVIKILVGLTSGDLPFSKFSSDTTDDIYDSFKDDEHFYEDDED